MCCQQTPSDATGNPQLLFCNISQIVLRLFGPLLVLYWILI